MAYIFHYLADAFSCDEVQKRVSETLPNGQYLLTNGGVSFKVTEMRESSLATLTKAKHNILGDNLLLSSSPPKMCKKY